MISVYYCNENKDKFINELSEIIGKRKPIFICIGSSQIAFDSVGAIVGNKISQLPCLVYGNTRYNIDALNLLKSMQFIDTMHDEKYCKIVIDAAIGLENEVGTIQLYNNGIMPGSATNKNLGKIGDASIVAVTSSSTMLDYYKTEREKAILSEKMADSIANCIIKAVI